MDQQLPTFEFILEAFVDPSSVRDVVRGILHTIFFHRFFPSVLPRTRDVLDLTLPYIENAELETLIDQRTAMLVRQLEAERGAGQGAAWGAGGGGLGYGGSGGGGSNHRGGRGQISVQFFEKRRRKAWYVMRGGEEEVCWESWTVKVTVAEPRTESERAKVRQAMESTLLAAVMKIVTSVNAHKDHIPPITTADSNPFPYQINVNQKEAGWATRMGIY
ncbi:duf1649 domain containing protein [Grosmannia clavigera kw1407]|uniref:Autophagy-related protein 101 n=1 Tax=Grosmannia clavigera (strain kw1407 / UAMH 11150) TaxID=655863 RepID=F0XH19_GROCL|nr:duf1649 domain containing protein [Grosmannia clavigera kw1407]EFX02711.1 duf1649 domain containing protein [Grosmannia clavigera kw1407]